MSKKYNYFVGIDPSYKGLGISIIDNINKTITFNEYLYKANLLGVQYVILHEMTHLLYPNHNIDFYNFLTIHMPDWKERKKILDIEVVQGIN